MKKKNSTFKREYLTPDIKKMLLFDYVLLAGSDENGVTLDNLTEVNENW